MSSLERYVSLQYIAIFLKLYNIILNLDNPIKFNSIIFIEAYYSVSYFHFIFFEFTVYLKI